ncbi:Hsp20 family protein [bacterium]|mgnify:FL=1|nr:Hsp20 family protein [bacterium]
MVNKQFRITSDSLSPLYKMSVGFDRMAEQFFNDPSFVNNGTGYPPYNISKTSDDIYEITLAVAGFKKGDIDISLEDGTLKIEGTSGVLDSDKEVEYLHKGIAERNFIRTFKLAEFVEVKDAKLEDGILKVTLFRNVPDALKPQKIKIS